MCIIGNKQKLYLIILMDKPDNSNSPTGFSSARKNFPDSGIRIPLHEERKFMMWGLIPVSQSCYQDTRTKIAQDDT